LGTVVVIEVEFYTLENQRNETQTHAISLPSSKREKWFSSIPFMFVVNIFSNTTIFPHYQAKKNTCIHGEGT
jgi:hypothetical protein